MSMSVQMNVGRLMAEIRNISQRASTNSARTLRRAAVRISKLAKAYAPHLTGALEEGIDYAEFQDGRRKAFVIFAPSIDHRGVDYVELMERALIPYGTGPFSLGDGSRAKNTTGKVGGRFLERAVDDGIGAINDEVLRSVSDAVEGRLTRGGFDQDPYGDEE